MQQYSPTGFRILPPVVKNLLIINGLFFLATLALAKYGIDLISILGLHYPGAPGFRIYQFVTYMFMHGGWAHIFFNMFALWMFGNVIENVWGGKKFLVFYLLTGLGSAVVYIFWIHFELRGNLDMLNAIIAHPTVQGIEAYFQHYSFHLNALTTTLSQSDINLFNHNVDLLAAGSAGPANIQQIISFLSTYKEEMLNQMVVIGASGAIFGLLLAFGMMFPNTLIYLYFAIPIKAKWFVIGYGLLELFSGISNRPGDNVAHFAHVGGMLVGLLIILYWKKKGHLFGPNM
ncbi:rhomboid family intramembrane serine protease [Candidatus Sulfidibacterium hydrothermale]|jgi:membrane associated rhomboid family serine protease|uniref:rhomboid family intramembrane serine protease n=1 Tax=Candidatus Sulfidibacterium hydrothermale TaxID=2875962 RepID=UPI001F0AA9E9|nr:rhomboid family intramembrane serine protease [Candidatus Sulfidibacterium hydrothermale]UBM61056.1 rhomboid family intramembrane serine protease [Candidatus Sulfidibacterium hydrothermale]